MIIILIIGVLGLGTIITIGILMCKEGGLPIKSSFYHPRIYPNEKTRDRIIMKNKIDNKLELITFWLMDFPCKKYLKNTCILEYLTPEELYKFIENKCKLKKR
jgi:hypothetical protein